MDNIVHHRLFLRSSFYDKYDKGSAPPLPRFPGNDATHLHTDGTFPGIRLLFARRDEFERDRSVERGENLDDFIRGSTRDCDTVHLHDEGGWIVRGVKDLGMVSERRSSFEKF